MDLKTPIFLLLITLYSVSGKKERIRLQDVETLTLYSDKWTTARRSAPVKQLNCVGGSCYRASIATAQCYNRGFDGNDVQWECKAEFPSNYKFGRLEVTCEGYEYPEDDYILTGSCGLEYTVVEVSKSSDSYFPSYTNMKSRDDDGAGSSMLTILVVFGAAIALYFYLKPSNEGQRQQSASGRSSYNTNPSAPPPPGFRPDFYGTNSEPCDTSDANNASNNSRRPGFFSGMAAGGFLGYLFGSSNRGNNGYGRHNTYDRTHYHTPSPSSYSFNRRSSPASSHHSSSTTSTSTSFASTKRR